MVECGDAGHEMQKAEGSGMEQEQGDEDAVGECGALIEGLQSLRLSLDQAATAQP